MWKSTQHEGKTRMMMISLTSKLLLLSICFIQVLFTSLEHLQH